MKKLAPALLLLAACSSAPSGPAGPAVRDEDMALGLALAYGSGYDPAQLRAGQWALYMIRAEGTSQSWPVKLQVVAQEGDRFWLELKVPAQPRPMVIKSQVDRTGKLYERWVGEPGSQGPTRDYPGARPDGQGAKPPLPGARANASVTDETITAGGRTYACKKVTTKQVYADGRASEMVTWCSPEVPFSFRLGEESLGGVVRRVYGKFVMELSHAEPTGARPELEIPRK